MNLPSRESVAAFAAGTTVAIAARAAVTIAARAAVTVTTGTALTAFGAFAARTAGTLGGLDPAFGFGLQGAHRQAIFAGLLVDLDEFHGEFVALLDA